MDENQPIDARDLRHGGFSWIQHELYTVFLPIIGKDAAFLYVAMAFMIPERQRSPVKYELSLRRIEKTTTMPKSTVHRELEVLRRIGLVEQIPQGTSKPPEFILGDLRKLARLGDAEIRRRLSVPQGDSREKDAMDGADEVEAQDTPQDRVERADSRPDDAAPGSDPLKAPAASDRSGVPQGDSEENEGLVADRTVEKRVKASLAALVLSQKPGGSVPETGGYCPRNRGVLSQAGDTLIKTNPIQEKTTPLPPEGGGCEISSVDRDAWTVFRVRLRQALNDVPVGLARRFDQVRPDERDANACFADWWLEERRDEAERVVLVVGAWDAEATREGIAKYAARLERLARGAFPSVRGRRVVFEVVERSRSQTVGEIAAAAEGPGRAGT